jgi:Flp pilus assembly protein TadD
LLAWVLVGLGLLMGAFHQARAQSATLEQAQAQVASQDWRAANDTIERGLSAHPNDARLRLLQGLARAQQGQLSQAQAVFEALIADHPELSEPYNNLGIVLALQGNKEEARRQFEKALLADPDNAPARSNAARLATP